MMNLTSTRGGGLYSDAASLLRSCEGAGAFHCSGLLTKQRDKEHRFPKHRSNALMLV